MFDTKIDEVANGDTECLAAANQSEKLKIIERITVLHPDFQAAVAAVDRSLKSYRSGGETICTLVLADAGCGKSHLTNRYVRMHPEYRQNGKLIKRVVRVRVPSDPTIKGVSTAILEQYHDPHAARGSEQEMAGRIDYYVQECQTELVAIEELNHFVDAESDKRNLKVANWMKIRIEETRVPFLAEGLLRTKVLFDKDDQLADRFDGPYILRPFSWFTRGAEPELADKPFRTYMHKLYEKFPFEDCIDFGDGDNPLRFFCISKGIPRRIGKLLKLAAILAEEQRSETIDLAVLEKAYAIRTAHRFVGASNPFSLDFKLDTAQEELKREATRPLKQDGEGLSNK